MHVAHFEARALAAQAARAESRKTPLVGKGRERVRLIHELAQLRPREEVVYDRAESLGVHEPAGREGGGTIVNRHAFAHEPFGARQAHAALVLEKFARGADATVAEVVDVVHLFLAHENLEEEADGLNHVDAGFVERAQILVNLPGKTEFLVDLVAADEPEIVVGAVEEEPLNHRLGVGSRGRIAGTHPLVDLLERILFVVDTHLCVFTQSLDERAVVDGDVHDFDLVDSRCRNLLHHGGGDRVVAAGDDGRRIGVDQIVLHDEETQILVGILLAGGEGLELVEKLHEHFVAAVAESPEEGGGEEFPAAAALIHEAPHDIVRIEHHLDPGTAVGDNADGKERLAVCVHLALRGNAGAAVQLAHDDSLGAIDDERAIRRHNRHIPEEHFFLADAFSFFKAECGLERP